MPRVIRQKAFLVVAACEVIGALDIQARVYICKIIFFFFMTSCRSLKSNSRGKKKPEPKGLLNQARKEALLARKTAAPAAGPRGTCPRSGSRRGPGRR